jgi:beta-glucosidase/6-phospho-beta-glucosidase/beta-galactosidase
MIQTYMEKVEEAVRLGYDLRGVMYWTLVDNFE